MLYFKNKFDATRCWYTVPQTLLLIAIFSEALGSSFFFMLIITHLIISKLSRYIFLNLCESDDCVCVCACNH